jgi:hypothetical protein
MNILTYKDFLNERNNNSIFSKLTDYSFLRKPESAWGKIESILNEGLGMEGENIKVDFDQDQANDVVRLNPARQLKDLKKAKVPVYRGYALEKVEERRAFMRRVKQQDAISQEDLEKLIAMTFPKELADRKVQLIFTTGSSDPLALNVAETIQSLYYPNAKIIDVMKKYYGADISDIVDQEAYDRADPVTRGMIDQYLAGRRAGFQGYIKKSSGLKSGARRILKPGHTIDDYIIDNIQRVEDEWSEKFLRDKSINPSVAFKFRPGYLFVDDIIIEGSTLRGIFNQMMDAVMSGKLDVSARQMASSSIFGYCLFSYKEAVTGD